MKKKSLGDADVNTDKENSTASPLPLSRTPSKALSQIVTAKSRLSIGLPTRSPSKKVVGKQTYVQIFDEAAPLPSADMIQIADLKTQLSETKAELGCVKQEHMQQIDKMNQHLNHRSEDMRLKLLFVEERLAAAKQIVLEKTRGSDGRNLLLVSEQKQQQMDTMATVMKTMEQELLAKTTSLHGQNEELSRAHVHISDLAKELAAREGELATCGEDLSKASHQVEETEIFISDLKNEYNEQEADLLTERDTRLQAEAAGRDARAALQEKGQELLQLECAQTQRKTEVESQQRLVSNLHSTISQLQQSLEETSTELVQTTRAAETRIADLAQQVQGQVGRTKELEESRHVSQNLFTAIERELAATNAGFAAEVQRVQEVQEERDALLRQVGCSKEEASKNMNNLGLLLSEKEAVQNAYVAMEQEHASRLQAVQSEKEELKFKVDTMSEIAAAKEASLSIFEKERSDLQLELDSSAVTNALLAQRLGELESFAHEAGRASLQLRQANTHLQEQLALAVKGRYSDRSSSLKPDGHCDETADVSAFNDKMKSLERQLTDAIREHGQTALATPSKLPSPCSLSRIPPSPSTAVEIGDLTPRNSPTDKISPKTLEINELFSTVHSLKEQSKSRAMKSIEKISGLKNSLEEKDEAVRALTARIDELEAADGQYQSSESKSQIAQLTATIDSAKMQSKARALQYLQRIKQLQTNKLAQSETLKENQAKVVELETSLSHAEEKMVLCQKALAESEKLHGGENAVVKDSALYQSLRADYSRLKTKVEQKSKEIMRLTQQMQQDRLQFQKLKKTLGKLDDSKPTLALLNAAQAPVQEAQELIEQGVQEATRAFSDQQSARKIQACWEFQGIQAQLKGKLVQLHGIEGSLMTSERAGTGAEAVSSTTSAPNVLQQKVAECAALRANVLSLETKLLDLQQETSAFSYLQTPLKEKFTSLSSSGSKVELEALLRDSKPALQNECKSRQEDRKKFDVAVRTIKELQGKEAALVSENRQSKDEILRLEDRVDVLRQQHMETHASQSEVQGDLAQQKLLQLKQAFFGLISARSSNDVNCHCRCICMILEMPIEKETEIRATFAQLAPLIPAQANWNDISSELSNTVWGMINN
mmetsp:Transcript_9090/g.20510  ORF Transcript_9090/g.20510 Transcript_9090/m.20510 type:complete len:1115 (+) Transcript_9090:880-4224(+)